MEDIWVEHLTLIVGPHLIRQFSYDGTISRFNRLSIHNKKFSA